MENNSELVDVKTLVSVIVPVFNGRDTVLRALKSLLRQSYENWECIVVDDGSDEPVDGLIKALNDSRFRYYSLEENRGRGFARQFALEKCKGEYIAFLDADDEYLPHKLEKQVGVLKNNSDIAVVSCNLIEMDVNSGESLFVSYSAGLEKSDDSPFYQGILEYPSERLPVPFACAMVRSSQAKKVGFNAELRESEDFSFLLPMLLKHKYALLEEPFYYYFVNRKSYLKKYLVRLSVTLSVMRSYKDQYPKEIETAEGKLFLKRWIATLFLLIKGDRLFLVLKRIFNRFRAIYKHKTKGTGLSSANS